MKPLELKLQIHDDTLYACAPQVGRVSLFSQLPRLLTEGSVVGTAQTLRTTYTLQMPAGGPWTLRRREVDERDTGVGVGAQLLELQLWEEGGADEHSDAHADGSEHYTSPMAGQFYLRPAPDKPAFIRVGDIIEPGTQLGLVEVMKFFYPLVFEGEGRWKITEIFAEDSTSLDAGDPVIGMERAEA